MPHQAPPSWTDPQPRARVLISRGAEVVRDHAAAFFAFARDTLARVDERLDPVLHILFVERTSSSLMHMRDDRSEPLVYWRPERTDLLDVLGMRCAWHGSLRRTVNVANHVDLQRGWLLAERRLGPEHEVTLVISVRRTPGWAVRRLEHEFMHGVTVTRSLLESLVIALLEQLAASVETVAEALRARYPEPRVVVRAAAVSFLDSLASRSFGPAVDRSYLFDVFDDITTLPYEGRDPHDGLVMARSGHPDLEYALRLAEPVPLVETRRVRKILELSSEAHQVVVDGQFATGLARVSARYDIEREDIFTIRLRGRHHWWVEHSGRRLLEVHAGVPHQHTSRVTRARLLAALSRAIEGLEPAHFERIWSYVAAVRDAGHGAMLVVHRDAEHEARRLTLDSFPIVAQPLELSMLLAATTIDGAVLLTGDGRCVAIGVIVDGVASGSANRTRGARYNSALRYVTSQRGAAVAVVTSDDGLADLVFFDEAREAAVT